MIAAGLRLRWRAQVNAALLAGTCGVCSAGPGRGCDTGHRDPGPVRVVRRLVLLEAGPPVVAAHIPRVAAAVRGRPVLRVVVVAQFEPGACPADLRNAS